MTPNINSSDPPRFYELGEFVFQELCRDLFEVQDGIVASEEHITKYLERVEQGMR
jgi:hypothetical protein